MAAKCVLKLYVTGHTPNSQKALKNLESILKEKLNGFYNLKVIDVLKNPQLAEEDKILATPALVKVLPPPVRKIIGDLSDREKVLLGFDLVAQSTELNKDLQSIHEQACINSSETLAKLTHRYAIVDIVNPNVKKLEELTPTIDCEAEGIGVRLAVRGGIEGTALLLFSRETAFNLSDLLIERKIGTTDKLTELDKSALKEVGNIVCGTYFATLSNRTGIKIVQHAPQFSFDKSGVILEQTITKFTQKVKKVLAVETEFNFTVPALRDYCFKSYFLVLFETERLEAVLGSSQQTAAERNFIAEAVIGRI